ncbi:MAG: hypothetical protein ACRC8Y_22210 [Chroococcales cyanobacterium]
MICHTSGPLPLARGGLGWGSFDVEIATSPTQRKRSPRHALKGSDRHVTRLVQPLSSGCA